MAVNPDPDFLKSCTSDMFDGQIGANFSIRQVDSEQPQIVEMTLVEVTSFPNRKISGIERLPFSILLKAIDGHNSPQRADTFTVHNDALGEFDAFGQPVIIPNPQTGPSVLLEFNFS